MKFAVIYKKSIIFVLLAVIIIAICISAKLTISATSASSPPIFDYTIVLDAGHGGIDPGAIGKTTKVKESEINLNVTKILQTYLKAFGVNVVLTRQDSSGLYGNNTKGYKKKDMLARKNIIEQNNADMVVSIHMNTYVLSSTRGAQVFYDEHSESSKSLSLCIQNMFAKNLQSSDKGISIGDYYMLKCTNSPSVICECGYLSNEIDEKLLQDSSYQDKIAYAIFCGIVEYLTSYENLV